MSKDIDKKRMDAEKKMEVLSHIGRSFRKFSYRFKSQDPQISSDMDKIINRLEQSINIFGKYYHGRNSFKHLVVLAEKYPTSRERRNKIIELVGGKSNYENIKKTLNSKSRGNLRKEYKRNNIFDVVLITQAVSVLHTDNEKQIYDLVGGRVIYDMMSENLNNYGKGKVNCDEIIDQENTRDAYKEAMKNNTQNGTFQSSEDIFREFTTLLDSTTNIVSEEKVHSYSNTKIDLFTKFNRLLIAEEEAIEEKSGREFHKIMHILGQLDCEKLGQRVQSQIYLNLYEIRKLQQKNNGQLFFRYFSFDLDKLLKSWNKFLITDKSNEIVDLEVSIGNIKKILKTIDQDVDDLYITKLHSIYDAGKSQNDAKFSLLSYTQDADEIYQDQKKFRQKYAQEQKLPEQKDEVVENPFLRIHTKKTSKSTDSSGSISR